MSFKNILAAVDESPQAAAALDLAIELARAVGASLTVVHAMDPSLIATAGADGAGNVLEIEMDELQTAGKELLETAAARVRAAGVDVTTILRDGLPAATILDTARHSDCDVIVLGTHGRHGVARVFLGSCAESVLRDSPVPVLIKRS
ncbi:MAG: universal stress protein [Vulcanimicrobiaceae bacterium]